MVNAATKEYKAPIKQRLMGALLAIPRKTTGYARGSKKAMPMSKSKEPLDW